MNTLAPNHTPRRDGTHTRTPATGEIRRAAGGGIDYNYYLALGHRERAHAVADAAREVRRLFQRLF